VHLTQLQLLIVAHESYAAGVDEQAAFDASPSGLLHAAPVLERLGHQAPGRDRDDGLVEVLYV